MSYMNPETISGTPTIEVVHDNIASLISCRHPSINRSYFTHPVYLRQLHDRDWFAVSFYRNGVAKDLIFRKSGNILYCCNRLTSISANEIDQISKEIFEHTSTDFLMLEDVTFIEKGKIERPHLNFSYQENWFLNLSQKETFLSSRQASSLRRKLRRFNEFALPGTVWFEFRRSRPEDIDTIITLNKNALKDRGKKHKYDEHSYQLLQHTCSEAGYIAGLYLDDKLIAGDIITIVGKEAFFHVVGYDPEFEKFSPGMQTHVKALTACKELHCAKANFLWGNSRWKSDLGGMPSPLHTIFVSRNGLTYLQKSLWADVLPHLKQASKRKIKKMLSPA